MSTPMNPTMILLFNHCLTAAQKADARISLGVDRIVVPPPEISRTWVEIPPDAEEITTHLAPVFSWLADCARHNDYVLIQGEFGATFIMVNKAILLGLTPIYSTTRREAMEEHTPDGRVHLRHTFSHVRYRRYAP